MIVYCISSGVYVNDRPNDDGKYSDKMPGEGSALENYWFPSEEELSRMDACLHGRPEPGLIVEGHYLLSVRLLSALVSLSKH